MKKLSKIAPIICGVLWFLCLVLSLISVDANYRFLFILASITLIVYNVMLFMKEKNNAGKAERSNDQ